VKDQVKDQVENGHRTLGFAHEKLQVYDRALDFILRVVVWTNSWDKRHALVDHLSRAAESVVTNLAEATRQRGVPSRLRMADFSVGSSLECAACLDIVRIKGLLSREQCRHEKQRLCEMTKMLIGLRKAWGETSLKEDAPVYRTESSPMKLLFHHEELEVYQDALTFMGWFVAHSGADPLSNRSFRAIDEAGTRMLLNIAEGNGRYAELDHRRFIQIAESGAVKAAVHLDLSVRAGLWDNSTAAAGKGYLRRISILLSGF
jgi:four helix bundle protein